MTKLTISIKSVVMIAIGTLFGSSNINAQVTPQHIATMETVIMSQISADGKYTAYTKAVPVDPFKENASSKIQLHVYNNLTHKSKPFYTASSVGQVKFRPNKGTITFLTRNAGGKTNAIYEMDINGGEARKLYAYTANIANYAWSNDGNKIAFISSEPNAAPKTSLTYKPRFYEENLSQSNAYIVDVVKNSDPQKINVTGSVYNVVWSPNGSKLAITVAPTSLVDDSYMAQAIKIVNAKNGNIIAAVDNKGKLGNIVWSPDGQKIAYISGYDLHDPTNGSIFVASATGGKPKILHPNYLGKFETIKWIDKQAIHFYSSEGTASAIGAITTDGKMIKYLVKSKEHAITSFDINNNGKITFTANTPKHPTELYALNNGKPVRLTNNNKWLKGLQLGKQEVIKYTARDGKYKIEGMLIYPIGYQSGMRVPLITVVHGGPESHYSNGWLTAYSMPGQMAAANGYAVFYPNYRGSTGRGIDFTYSSQADLGGKEFDDIVDGVDYLIAKGIADKDRVGVTGGSYGGYASAWMSTYYSHRFAAAVMFVGISNNISKFGTSDIPNEMHLVHEREYIWDHWEKYMKSSPIYHVDKAQTPILIMHGADDPRVHPAQSMELYRHLKVRKPEVPVRLIYYPGEGHGNARSGSRYDYNLRMMQWFETYLKTGNKNATMPSLDLPE